MPQLNFYVTLIGGPPWGFRIKQQDGDLPIVTQVRPNSRACNGGVRVGDVIESVNGKLCVLASEIYKKMSLLQGVIKLKLNRRNVYEQKPLFLFYLSSDTDSESTPELAKPTIFLSDVCINPAAKPPFKNLATAHKNSVFSLINDHESHSPSKNTSHSTISESSTDISGYDTVAGDYYDQCTPINFQDSWSCQKKILQTDGAKPFLTFNGNESTIEQALRAESTTQLAIRLNVDRQPSLPCVDQSNNGNSSSVDKSDGNEYSYLFIDQNMHDKFIDSNAALLDAVNPSTVGAMDLEKSKKWSIRVDQKNEDKPATIITSSVKTGKASGQVEVPPPQSVAELRAQIAAKLIVRNPTENKNSSLPSKDTLFFKKHQPAKLCDQKLISTSTLSLDRAPQSSESSDLHGCFSTKESQFTREVSPTPSLSSLKDCDKLRKCNQSRTKFYEEKRCFTPTLKRQHSQLQLRPEVQHAVVLIPKNGKQGPLMRASVSMLNLSTQSEHSPPPLSFHSPTVPKNENHVLSGSSMYPSTLSNNYCFDNTANNEQEITDVSFNENVNVCDNVFECQSERLNCDQRDAPFEELSVDQEYLLNRSHNFSKVDISKPICQNESHADKPNSHVSESFVDTANVNQKKEQFENVPKLNRLTELIDLAKKSFGDKSDNSELIDKLWFKTLEDKNRPNLPTGMLYRPQSVMELSSNSNMTKHCTLPAQNHRQKSQSQWYRQITRQIHHPSLKNSEQDMPGDVVLEQDVSNLKLNTSQPSVDHQLTNISPQRLRAKSVGRYDAVADMEILDKFMQQRQQHNLNANDNNRDKINFIKGEAQQIASTSYMETTQNRQNYLSSKNNSNNAARAANSYAMSRSKTQHFHLPSYRFVHEDARPFVSPRSCYCCGKNRRDYASNEVEYFYFMLDNATLKKETERESLGEKIKLRYIENRLQDTAQGLQKIVKQLESYGKTRSKSNPEIAYKLRNCRDKFNYFVGQKQSDVNKHVKTTDDVKKNLLEEVIQRQKAEKLSEELNDQRSRQHSYYPGAAPVLQNNVQRFNHLMYSSQTNDVEGNSNQSFTPNRRSTNVGSIQTCTVLYKFVAQTPRELNLNRGDVVRVHREVDNNWIEGERNGRVGIFPASYVQIDEESSASNNRVQALHPFQARNRNELSLRKNEVLTIRREIDVNWIEGTNSKGQIGIFPRCYICDYNEANDNNLISSHIPDRPKTPKIVTTSNSYRTESPLPSKKEANHIEQVQQWEQRRDNFGYSGPARLVPKNSETYRVLYSYKPEYSDELELQENDIVFVVEKCDDGWFIGTLLRNGQLGTFPGNYVEKH